MVSHSSPTGHEFPSMKLLGDVDTIGFLQSVAESLPALKGLKPPIGRDGQSAEGTKLFIPRIIDIDKVRQLALPSRSFAAYVYCAEEVMLEPRGIEPLIAQAGKARAEKLSPERRKEIARKAAKARWDKKRQEESS